MEKEDKFMLITIFGILIFALVILGFKGYDYQIEHNESIEFDSMREYNCFKRCGINYTFERDYDAFLKDEMLCLCGDD